MHYGESMPDDPSRSFDGSARTPDETASGSDGRPYNTRPQTHSSADRPMQDGEGINPGADAEIPALIA